MEEEGKRRGEGGEEMRGGVEAMEGGGDDKIEKIERGYKCVRVQWPRELRMFEDAG